MLSKAALIPLLALLGSAAQADPQNDHQNDQKTGAWTSVFRDRASGLEVFAREVPGSPVRELRASALLDVPATQVVAVLLDVTAHPGMLPPIAAARMLRHEGPLTFYHMVIHPPWVSRRDYCIHMELTHPQEGHDLVAWAQDDAQCPPPVSGMVRMRRNYGSWDVQAARLPDGGMGTRVVYQALTDPGGSIPTWIVNRSSPRALPDIFSALRSAAHLPRYASR